MIFLFDLISFIICTLIFLISISRIYKKKFNVFHPFVIVFYLFQVVQIFIDLFRDTNDLDMIAKYYPYMYLALTDDTVSVVYDIFVVVCTMFLYYHSNKFKKYDNFKIVKQNIPLIKYRELITKISFIICLIPIIVCFFSPDPSVYTVFANYQVISYNEFDPAYIYHKYIVSTVVYFAFFSVLAYYIYDGNFKEVFSFLFTCIITWINGKRTIGIILLLLICAIDILKWDKKDTSKLNKILFKCFLFLLVIVGYYMLYNFITNKANFADNYLLYTIYFSRLCNVKISIYDILYTNNMLNYPGETILFNLLFFIPRAIWETKPLPFFTQFTSYTFFGKPNIVLPNMQFQVNIWSEFISNFGLLGVFINLLFIKNIIRISEQSQKEYIVLFGTSFILLYMIYGFESLVLIIYLLWIVMLLTHNIIKRFVHKR